MSSSSDDHNCPICLEPLFASTTSSIVDANGNPVGNNSKFNIGATVPCGHLYHYDCFGSWQASRSYGAVKCPTCNVKTENFVRLYLDVGSLSGTQCQLVGEDDISLSSIEDEKREDCEDHDKLEETEQSEESNSGEVDNESTDVVDLTGSPRPIHRESPQRSTAISTPSADEDDPQRKSQLVRLTRIAKKFKKQYLQKSSQYKEQYTEKRKLSDRVRKAECELQDVKEEMSKIERERELTELRLNESRLGLMRIQREQTTLKSQYSTMAKEKSRAEIQLRECHSHYAKELEKARAKSMSEVQEILEDHPKVVEENRILKQKLQKLSRTLPRGSGINETGSFCRPKELNKVLRQVDQQIRSRQNMESSTKTTATTWNGSSRGDNRVKDRSSQAERQKERPNNSSHSRGSAPIRVNSGHYSSLASRMIKASQKAKRPPPDVTSEKNRASITSLDFSHKRRSTTSLKLSQNKRMKSFSASRRDLFQRKP